MFTYDSRAYLSQLDVVGDLARRLLLYHEVVHLLVEVSPHLFSGHLKDLLLAALQERRLFLAGSK